MRSGSLTRICSQKKCGQCNTVGVLPYHHRCIFSVAGRGNDNSDKVSPQKPASVEAHTHLAHSVVRYLGLTAPRGHDFEGECRTFLTLFSLPIRSANYSCLPNAVVVFPRSGRMRGKEPIMNIIALRDIEIGEEVCRTPLRRLSTVIFPRFR
jgi:hypothetical protein